jgi:hypothetical protein
MTRPGDKSKKMKIKIKTEDGTVDPIKDDKGKDATWLSEEESEQIYNGKDTQHLGEILYTHSSPG